MSRLDQHVAGVQNRLMLERILSALAWSLLIVAILLVCQVLCAHLAGWRLPRQGVWVLTAMGVVLVVALARGYQRRPSAREAAIFLDDKLALQEKFSTALYARALKDPFAAAAVRDAERTAENVSIHRRFPIAWPAISWATIGVALLALGLTLLPQFDLAGTQAKSQKKIQLAQAQAVKAERSVRQALVELDAAPKAVADTEGVKLAKQDLTNLLRRPISDPVGAQKKAESALAQMDAVKQQINDQQKYADAQIDLNAFKEMLPSADEKGSIPDAQRAIAAGDMSKAVEDVKQAVDKFDKMDQKDQEKTAQQMSNLAQQLAQQANDPKTQQQIQQQLQQMGASQQQAQQMAQQMQLAANGNQQAMQQLQQMANQLAQQQNAQQGGSSQQQQQRAQAVQQAMQKMQQSANGQSQSQQLAQAASQLAQAMKMGIPVAQAGGQQQQQASAGQQKSQGQQGTQGQQGAQGQQGSAGQKPGGQGSQPGEAGAGSPQQQQQQMAAASKTMQQQLQQMQAMAKDGQAVAAGQQGSKSQDGQGDQASAGQGNQPGQSGAQGGKDGQGSKSPGQGSQPGSGQGQQSGGQWAANQNPQQGQGGGQGGGHNGQRPDPLAVPFGSKQELSPSQTIDSGKIIASSFVKAPADKGKSNIKLSNEIVKEEQEATDEVEQDRIPRSAQNAVKDYFQTLKDDAK